MTVTNSLVTMTGGHLLFNKLIPSGKTLITKALSKDPKAALTIAAIIAGGFALKAGWTNLTEGWGNLTKDITESEAYEVTTNWLGGVYEGTVGFIGGGVVAMDKMVSQLPFITPGTFTQTVGIGLAVASVLFATGTGALPALIIGGGFGAAGSIVHNIFPQSSQWLSGLLTPFMNTIASIPAIGGFLANHSSQPLALSSNRFSQEGSPIYISTATEAIAYDSSKYLQEAGDWTGSRTKALFANPTYNGQSYSEESSRMADTFKWTKPKSLVSPLIDREANIRAQYYNQAVVGAAM